MKKVISVFLAVISLLLTPVTVLAESDGRSAPAMCYQVELNFVDMLNLSQTITPTFMVPADKSTVYVKAEDIVEFLSDNYFFYECEQTYKEFSVACADLNYAVTYKFDSKDVIAYVAGSKIKYKAPAETLYIDDVTWIPFEFTMKLFNISYSVENGVLELGLPQYSALMVIAALYGKNSYSFSWTDELNLSFLNNLSLSASASAVTSFAGLFTRNSTAAWIDLFTFNVMNKTEEQYAEKIAMLFTSPSMKETETLKDHPDYLTYDKLASHLTKSTKLVSDINAKGLADAMKAISKATPTLNESCTRLSKFFTKNAASIEKITNAADKANGICDNFSKYFEMLVNLISFWQSFANKNQTAADVLTKYATNNNVKHNKNLAKFASMDQDDSVAIVVEYFEDNMVSIATSVTPAIDTALFYADLAWDIFLGAIPGAKETLDSTDSFKLSELGIYYQNDAKTLMNKYKNQALLPDSVNQSNLEDLVDYTYAYLKFSIISRNAAQKAIENMTEVSKNHKTDFANSTSTKHRRIGMYLAVLENAKPNETNGGIANYGYLPSDVSSTKWDYANIISFLEKNGTKLGTVTQKMEVIDEFTRTPGDGTISEEEAIQMVKDLMGGSMSTLIFEGILKDFYTFQVLDTPYIKSESIYAYIVTMELEGERDMYCLFVPVDGSELWIGWRVEDNIFCCYTEIDMKNVSITELITKMDELYQKEARGEEIPLEIVKVDPKKMVPYESGPAEVA